MRRRKLTLTAGIILCLLVFMTGCTPTYVDKGADTAKAVTVTVKIIAEDKDKPLYNGSIAVKSANPNLAMATYQALITAKVSYSEVGGEYDNFSGYPTTVDKAWVCTVNGARIQNGEKQQSIQDGDKIEWNYEKLS